MDRVEELLETIVAHEVKEYSNRWDYDAHIYYFEEPTHKVYQVLVIPESSHPILKTPLMVILARIVGDYVLIEADNTDKPLVDALVYNGGIPREKIILRYQGETLPENVTS